MNEKESEGHLIDACRRGDGEAFRELFEVYQHRVWSIALYYSGDEAAAHDISQQVFLKLFTSIGQFRGEANFATWLYRLVVNACQDERRRRRRFISFDFLRSGDHGEREMDLKGLTQKDHEDLSSGRLPRPAGNSTQEEHYSQLEISEAIKAALKQLNPKLRMAILLKYFEGLSYQEMAGVLGCSTGTVASRLNRGHKELARALAHLRGAFQINE